MNPELKQTKVTATQAGQTVSALVRSLYPDLSWNQARSWIRSGHVFIDGRPVFDPALRTIAGQALRVDPKSRRSRCPPLEPERLLHVDREVVVVSKPAGLVTAPYKARGSQRGAPKKGPRKGPSSSQEEHDTLIDRTALALKRLGGHRGSVGRGRNRDLLGIVQRLDKDTTGVMVFARTRAARQSLENQFRKHTIQRQYYALARGGVQDGTIESYLLSNRGDGKRGSYRGGGKAPVGARKATTHVQVEELLPGGDSLICCHLETGRQHQIRIHLAEQGHPLLGESIYTHRSPTEATSPDTENPLLPRATRPMLHAHILGFHHPSHGRLMLFQDPLPEDFTTLLEHLRRPG